MPGCTDEQWDRVIVAGEDLGRASQVLAKPLVVSSGSCPASCPVVGRAPRRVPWLANIRPSGKYLINVCLGTACYVKGADRVAQRFMDELGVTFGETTTDGVFTLEGSRCLGTCGLAPIVMIEEDVHAQVTPDQVPVILEKYLEKSRKSAVAAP